MKLYYAPGACSLSPHVALRESGLPFELVKVDFANGRKLPDGKALADVFPRNYVPALQLEDGSFLGENQVMIRFIADKAEGKNLAPKHGTTDRLRFEETLGFIATELHKGMSPLFAPNANEEYKNATKERLATRYKVLESMLGDKPWLAGDQFTVADGYALWNMRMYEKMAGVDLAAKSPKLAAYKKRIEARPAVQEALKAEGLS